MFCVKTVQKNYLIRRDGVTLHAELENSHLNLIFIFISIWIWYFPWWPFRHRSLNQLQSHLPFEKRLLNLLFDIACSFRIHHPCRHGSYSSSNTFQLWFGMIHYWLCGGNAGQNVPKPNEKWRWTEMMIAIKLDVIRMDCSRIMNARASLFGVLLRQVRLFCGPFLDLYSAIGVKLY